jgi:hypothetical protein
VSKRDEVEEAAPAEEDPLPLEAPWTPRFDKGDDLDGLLDAGTPLLGRAFSGRPRPQGSRGAT